MWSTSAAETLAKSLVHSFDAIALVGLAMSAKGNAATTELWAESKEHSTLILRRG